MLGILYYSRCRCNEKFSVIKKSKLKKYTQGKPIQYPSNIISKTFYIKYEKNLSLVSKFILNSFRNKYIYYAIDDILYLLNSNPIERDKLLSILYSPILLLQNNFYVNFFDIWIQEIYINEIPKPNKFMNQDYKNFKTFDYIIVKFLYKTSIPSKKIESLW